MLTCHYLNCLWFLFHLWVFGDWCFYPRVLTKCMEVLSAWTNKINHDLYYHIYFILFWKGHIYSHIAFQSSYEILISTFKRKNILFKWYDDLLETTWIVFLNHYFGSHIGLVCDLLVRKRKRFFSYYCDFSFRESLGCYIMLPPLKYLNANFFSTWYKIHYFSLAWTHRYYGHPNLEETCTYFGVNIKLFNHLRFNCNCYNLH